MHKSERFFNSLSIKANWIAAGAVILIMLITTADVLLRIFNASVPGAYELAGLFGSVIVSFSLAYTSIERGHIAVEFLTSKLSQRTQRVVFIINDALAGVFFAIVSWQTCLYGLNLQKTGEVSLTLQMPTYPFAFGIAVSSLLLSIILIMESFKSLRGRESL